MPRVGSETTEQQCRRLLNNVKLPKYYDTYIQMLDGETDYIVFEDKVYKCESEELSPYDHFSAKRNNDGTIGFSVSFYNGGCGFKEAIEYALKNIK